MPDILIAALRRSTVQPHADIEVLLGLDEPFDLAHYGQVLRGFEAFHAAWEADVAQALPGPLQTWFFERCRGHLARRDLAALGLQPVSSRTAAVPRVVLGGLSRVMGSLYVMEGSALGGQVLARRLSQRFGIGPEQGGAYFTGWGPRTGAMWREFQQMLNAHDESGADHAQACRAASDTFQALAATFERVLHARAPA